MISRGKIALLGISVLLTVAPPVMSDQARQAAAQRQSPNFLFILADDVTYSDLGCFGGKNVKTPNIDRLARQGMRFNRAYCAMSMCAPFRAELYTGLYPVRNGVAWNHSIARPGTKSICHYLRELNYRVGLTGKKHASPADVFPFDSVKQPLAGPGAREFITRDATQPFCLFVCSHNAHPPWRSGDVSQIDREGMTLPPVVHDNPITRKTFAAYLAEIAALDDEVGAVLQLLEETGQAGNTLVMFSSEQGWDFAFGKWTNWDIGVRTALIARWPGQVKPGTETDALVQIADVVPTFIAAAGGDPAAHRLDGVSFLPVLQGKSDKHRRYVYGLHNNVPEGNPYPIRSIRDDEFHFLVNIEHDQPYHEKHLMTEGLAKRYDLQWWQALSDAAARGDASAKKLYDKYHHRPAEELYRVDFDRWEMNNLADKPEYAEAKERLRAELQRWMTRQNDPGAAMDDLEVHAANRKAGGKTYVVDNRAANASDDNPGSEILPLKTIQAGANRARRGDTVLVKAGIYREQVVLPRGGTSPQQPITYRAAPGEEVSIRGSQRITTWKSQGGGVWMVELDTAFFKGYNPFAIPVSGKWLFRGRDRRLGDVYSEGEAYLQKLKIEEMKSTPHTWYTDTAYGYKNKTDFPDERQYPGGKIQIWANFGDTNPNTSLTEINARATAIFPHKPGLKNIVIDGFDVRHTAPQWGDIYTLEKGAIGTRYGYGWTIQNCTITNSRNIGISLGVTDEVHFPRGDEGGLLEGGSNIPPWEAIGHHVIRNNVIKRCGQTGIYGCYGAVGCVIEGNVISETNYRNEWFGTNQAAIKILFPIDVVIRGNLIIGTPGISNGTKGIWLDWGSQNTRVTGNVVCDFGSSRGLFLEVNFGPLIVDNNIFVRSSIIVESNGSVLAHNLFSDCDFLFMASPNRIVPYYKPHSTVRAGKTAVSLQHNRIFNNIIIGGAGFSHEKVVRNNVDASGIQADHNVYLAGAGGFPDKDQASIVDDSKTETDFKLGDDAVTLNLNVPPAVFQANCPLITSKLIGKVPLADMFMEHPDGTPLDITTDYFGEAIDPTKVNPGPFQDIKPGNNSFRLRPK